MNKTLSMPRILALCATLLATSAASAATNTWDAGGGADLSWSNAANWTGTPATTDNVVFTDTGGAPSGITSNVTTNTTIASLNFQQTSATNQTLSIANGATLTVNGSFTPSSGAATAVLFGFPGNSTAADGATTLTGGGSFVVNNSAASFLVGYINNNASWSTVVDMSGLNTFTANVSTFGVGRYGANAFISGTRNAGGVLTLPQASNITATTISVGDSRGLNGTENASIFGGSASALYLGAGGAATNNLNANTIYIANGRQTGTLAFAVGAVAADTATIRGSNGTSAVAEMRVGTQTGGVTSGASSGNVDFGVGKVDALITNLYIGGYLSGASGSRAPSGIFTIGTNAESNVSVTTAYLAYAGSNTTLTSPSTVSGTLNVNGGVFTAGTLNLSTGNLTGNLTKSSTVNVDGGTLRVGAFGTPTGTNSITINLKSGGFSSNSSTDLTLNRAYNLGKSGGSTMTFGQASGGTGNLTLSGVGTLQGNTTVETLVNTTTSGNVTGGFGVTKTGAATWTLSGNNTFTGGVTVNAGTLKVAHSGALGTGSKTVSVKGAVYLDLDGSAGNIALASGISIETSGNGIYGIRNVAGDNTINGQVGAAIGSGNAAVISNGGSLTLAGTVRSVNSGNRTIFFDGTSTGANTVSGQIIDGSSVISVTKQGAGTWALSGNNTYSGTTTVTAGTLVLSGGGAINSSANITVSNGATLTNNNTTTAVDRVLSLGEGSTLSGTGNFTTTDPIAVSGNLGDGFATINLSCNSISSSSGALDFTFSNPAAWSGTVFSGSAASGLTFTSVSVGGTSLVETSGTFTADIDGFNYTFIESAKSLSVTAIPEPGTWILVGIGLAFLLYRKPRRRLDP